MPSPNARKTAADLVSTAAPLTPAEAARLFAPLADAPALALAVSGGVDSMALMTLVSRWREQHASNTRPKVVVLSLDHRLRPEAAEDVRFVGEVAKALGLAFKPLTWEGEKPGSRMQERARAARYRLLAEAARAHGADVLVTAHHLNDQSETFFMRLARGSGLTGLCGMRRARALEHGVKLFRPLLEVPRARLVATIQAHGGRWREDPSNHNPRFERTRVRAALAATAHPGGAGGLEKALVQTQRRLTLAEEALEALTVKLEREAAIKAPGFVLRLETAVLCDAPLELVRRLVDRLARRLGGRALPLNHERTLAIAEALCAGSFSGATVAGVRLLPAFGVLWMFPEAGRTPLPPLSLAPKSTFLWGGRYRVRCGALSPEHQWLLTTPGRATLADVVPETASCYRALRHLPAPARHLQPLVLRDGVFFSHAEDMDCALLTLEREAPEI